MLKRKLQTKVDTKQVLTKKKIFFKQINKIMQDKTAFEEWCFYLRERKTKTIKNLKEEIKKKTRTFSFNGIQ